MNVLLDLLVPAAVLGCGLVAGIFFAFSTFIMTALGRLPPSQGIASMQAINITIERLAKVALESTDGAALWTHYLVRWNFWNHVRAAASLAATASFVVAIASR